MESKTKFNIGDKVKTIRGDWFQINGNIIWYNQDTIGSIGIIEDVQITQNKSSYSLLPIKQKGLNLKHSWFDDDDLILVQKRNSRTIKYLDKK